MYSCSEEESELPTSRRWWEEAKHCPGRLIRRPARVRNLVVQVRHAPIAHPRISPRVGPMERIINVEYKAAKVADLRRIRRARERSRARRLTV